MRAITEIRATLILEVVQNGEVTGSTTVKRTQPVAVFTSDTDKTMNAAASAIHRVIPEMMEDGAVGVLSTVNTRNE